MTTPLALPEYPESGGFMFNERNALLAANDYLVRKNAYWESRCRVALEFIQNEAHEYGCATTCGSPGPFPCDCNRIAVLDAIGDLPELPAQSASEPT